MAVHRLHEILDVEHGLAKETVATLLLDLQKAPLNGPHAGSADVAVLGGELLGVVSDMLQHAAKILQVQEQQTVVVRDLEHQIQDARLGVVQIEHAGQQQRAHVGDGCPHRVTLFTENIPDRGGACHRSRQIDSAVGQHLGHLLADVSGLADAGQVAFDIGHEYRHADRRETLGQLLQGHRLACASGTGNQPVPVGQLGQQMTLGGCVSGDQQGVGHGVVPRSDGRSLRKSKIGTITPNSVR